MAPEGNAVCATTSGNVLYVVPWDAHGTRGWTDADPDLLSRPVGAPACAASLTSRSPVGHGGIHAARAGSGQSPASLRPVVKVNPSSQAPQENQVDVLAGRVRSSRGIGTLL